MQRVIRSLSRYKDFEWEGDYNDEWDSLFGKKWLYGDCEDYALTLADDLVKVEGFSTTKLSLVYCQLEYTNQPPGDHLVLWVEVDDRTIVLDVNFTGKFYRPEDNEHIYKDAKIKWISYHRLNWKDLGDWRRLK